MGRKRAVPPKPERTATTAKEPEKKSRRRAIKTTARKPGNDTLNASDARYRAVIETSADGFWLCNRKGQILEVNEAYIRCSGYSREELLKMTVPELEASEDPAETAAHIEKVIREGSGLFETLHRAKDGTVWPVEVSASYSDLEGGLFFGHLRDLRQRKLAEKQLRDSQTLYHDLVETAQDLIWQCDAEGRYVFLNPAWERVLGYTVEEMLGRKFMDFQDPTVAERDVDTFSRLLEGGPVIGYETVHRAKDGTDVHLVFNAKLYHDEHGKVAGTRGSAYDITERNKAKETLRKSEELLRQSQFVTRVGHYVFNITARTWSSSDVLNEIFGVGPDYVRTMDSWLDIIHPEDRQEMIDYMVNHVIHGGMPFDREYRIMRISDGTVHWVHGLGNLEFSEDGQPVRMFGTIQDISDRKSAELALHESERKYRQLVENANSIILMWNSEGRVTFFNRFAEKFFGFTEAEIVGKHVVGTIVPETESSSGRDLGHLMREICENPDRFEDNENENVTRNGRRVWVRWRNRAILNSEGKPLGVLSLGIDETDRKKAEEALTDAKNFAERLIQTANVIFVQLNLRGEVIRLNEAAEQVTGYSLAELEGKSWFETIVPRMQYPYVWKEFARITEQGGFPKVFENPIRTRSGEERYIVWQNSVLSEGAEIVGTISFGMDITDRRRTEEQLHQSEANLNRAQAVSHVGSWTWHIPSGELEWSDEMYRIFGLERMNSSGNLNEVVSRAIHPDDRAAVEQSNLSVIRDRRPVPLEYRVVRPDGTLRVVWAEAGELTLDGEGHPLQLTGIVQDITERKKAEKKLKHMHDLMDYVISHAQTAIAVHDKDLRYIYVSDQYLQQYNIEEKDVIGKHHYDVFPDLPQKWRDVHQRVLAGAVEGKEEDPYFREDGTMDWTRWQCRPWYEADGSIGGLIVYTEVITERKRREEALKESEARFRQIAETISEVFWVGAPDWKQVHYVSPAYERIWGRPCESLYTSPLSWIDNVHPEDRDALAQAISEKTRGGNFDPDFPEYRVLLPDGTMHWVHARAYPVFDAQGQVIRIVGIAEDITERQMLKEEQLKTQKLEAIGTLAGGIAHDFNNLLQGVFGYVSLAKLSTHDSKKVSRLLDEAESALSLSVNLTNQLLTFAKGGKPVKKTTELGPVIEGAVKFSLSGSRCDYRLKVPPDLWPAEADEGQISQVIQNIVLNACEAMPASGTVDISAENISFIKDDNPAFPDGGRFIRIAIKDSGIGIPHAYLARIFDPYFTTKQKGSGLGLATAYSIVNNHGGTIEVNSEQNAGTTFLVTLPVSDLLAREDEWPAIPIQLETRKGRVLLMDDEEMIRNVGRNMLEALGHDIVLAAHGEDAIGKFEGAMAAGQPFDFVILDLTIKGGMGGEETLRHLKDLDPAVKAVVSSGYADDPIVSDHAAHGFTFMLKKPYSIRELKACLNALLN